MTPIVNHRLAEQSDEAFIYKSWLRTGRVSYMSMGKDDYYEWNKKRIAEKLSRSKVLIACDANSPEVIFSFLVFEPMGDIPVFHFAYTKAVFRNFGLVKQMVSMIQPNYESEPIVVTFKNKAIDKPDGLTIYVRK